MFLEADVVVVTVEAEVRAVQPGFVVVFTFRLFFTALLLLLMFEFVLLLVVLLLMLLDLLLVVFDSRASMLNDLRPSMVTR